MAAYVGEFLQCSELGLRLQLHMAMIPYIVVVDELLILTQNFQGKKAKQQHFGNATSTLNQHRIETKQPEQKAKPNYN